MSLVSEEQACLRAGNASADAESTLLFGFASGGRVGFTAHPCPRRPASSGTLTELLGSAARGADRVTNKHVHARDPDDPGREGNQPGLC